MSKFQYTVIDEKEPLVPGFGPARKVYTAKGDLPTLPPGVKNLHENLLHGAQVAGDKHYMGHRLITDGVAGPYEWQGYNQVLARVIDLGAGLVKLGLAADTNIGLFSINKPEWVIAEHACYVQAMITVPLYDTLGAEAIEYILTLTETPLVVCTEDKVKKLLDLAQKIPSVKHIVVMDAISTELKDQATKANVELHLMTDVEKLGASNPIPKAVTTSETVATLCFTSGTTGVPKGVILTHGNILSFVAGALAMSEEKHMHNFNKDDSHISYLPLAHIFERVVQATLTYSGAAIGFYQGDTLKLLDDVAELQPTIFVSVPRLYNKIYDKVMAGVKAAGGISAFLFKMACDSKKSSLPLGKYTHWLWDALVFRKIKAKLGGRVKVLITGAAPISAEVIEFLKIGFCCPVIEGYGQTENSASSSSTIFVDHSSGHIGVPFPQSVVKLRDVPEMNYTSNDKPYPRGEICVKGGAVFKGYYKNPEKTAETLSSDGWLYSGDIGQWDDQGRLQIIDRVKNIFKLAQGEYIAPDKIEALYVTHEVVAQVFVYGDSLQSTLVAIVVPEETALVAFAAGLKLPAQPFAELCKSDDVRKAVAKALDAHGRSHGLQGFENVKAVYLETEPFSDANGLLSPTFKFKRHEGKIKYQTQIDSMYAALSK